MARPSPQVYLQSQLSDDSDEQIVSGTGYWVVVYRNQVINIVTKKFFRTKCQTKYIRTGFSNQAHAYNLADKLNQRYNTNDFTVREIII